MNLKNCKWKSTVTQSLIVDIFLSSEGYTYKGTGYYGESFEFETSDTVPDPKSQPKEFRDYCIDNCFIFYPIEILI